MRASRVARSAVVLALVVLAAACTLPLSTPGSTASIQFLSSETLDGWHYDYYRNTAYPCAISGYQTFAIGTKVGSSPTVARPLWAFMHGGGAGYFDANGNPQPTAGQKKEEPITRLVDEAVGQKGLLLLIRNDPAGFRTVSVSYCSHDVYAGVNSPDPHNPNTTPDGQPRTTNGVLATKAAIAYAQSKYPTTKVFLHGTSAGSAGTFGVAWSMEQQGVPPAGIVADASLVNAEGMSAAFAQGLCTDDNDPARVGAIAARVHPDLANVANEPDKLVASGRLTVPIMHVWNHGDQNTCGSPPMSCPLRDGSVVTIGLTDCLHEPMRLAIAAQGPASRSLNLPVCVDAKSDPVKDCSMHVTTPRVGTVNTDPASPADYEGAILTWVHARLADA